MLSSGNVDAVVISTPAESHARLANEALSAGMHVFVEKPMTTNLAAACDLTRLAQRRGVQLMVGHILRYHPAFRTLVELFQEGRIGVLQHITAVRMGGNLDGVRENVLWEYAPHDISMILALADSVPSGVVCCAGDSDNELARHALVSIGFGNGLEGHVISGLGSPKKEQRLVVYGSEATVVFNDVAPAGEELLLYPRNSDDVEVVLVPEEEPLAEECSAFVRSIRTGQAASTDGIEGVRVMQVLDACFRSVSEGGRVPLSSSVAHVA